MRNSTLLFSSASTVNTAQKRKTVLVLGGYGFVGRYTVKALRGRGVRTLIGTRGLGVVAQKPDERHIVLHQALHADEWYETLRGVDVVINTVGILRERKAESFDAVHHSAVKALAHACRARHISLVHMSALGIDGQSENPYMLSKLRGEEGIVKSQCTGAIVRTSVVDAPDGYGSGWLHRVANWPVWLMPAGAIHKISPVDANDVGEALATLALSEIQTDLRLIDLGCGEILSLSTYLEKLRCTNEQRSKRPLLVVRIPQPISRLFAHIFDALHITPYSIGHHELLEFDNIPVNNQLPNLLGRRPTPIGSYRNMVTSGRRRLRRRSA